MRNAGRSRAPSLYGGGRNDPRCSSLVPTYPPDVGTHQIRRKAGVSPSCSNRSNLFYIYL